MRKSCIVITRRKLGASVLFLALLTLPSCTKRSGVESETAPVDATTGSPKPRYVVDTHVHVSPTEIPRFIDIADEVGIGWALNLSGGWGKILKQQVALAHGSHRLLVACNLPWHYARVRPDFPEIAVKILEDAKLSGARALKIEKALGFSVRAPDGRLVAVDDPWLDPVWAAAGRLGLPVVIHTGDPKAFWLPVDEKNERYEELTAHPRWSNYNEPVPSFEALLNQLMKVVKRHEKTTFVSVHFGNNAEDPDWVGRMLAEHPNLYVDLAARIPEVGRHDPERVRKVFLEHHQRILFGSDLGVSPREFLMLGSFGEEPNKRNEVGPFFSAHWTWLETRKTIPSPTPIQGRWSIHGLGLPREVLEDVYYKNAMRLFGPPPPDAPMPPK